MDLDALPPVDQPLDRLQMYQRERGLEEERRRVAEILFKRDLGETLTQRELTILAYSPYGTAAGCHC